MSRWDFLDGYVRRQKKPPPERGIRMRKAGTTWWGKRWIDALESLTGAYSTRLSRGRTYARNGRVAELQILPGEIKTKVTGSRYRPYKVRFEIEAFTDEQWSAIAQAVSGESSTLAALLADRMPESIDELCAIVDRSLFPEGDDVLSTRCDCATQANPCKHIAATHYVLGELFDRDPFVLFELRGRDRATFLDEVEAFLPEPTDAPDSGSAPRPEARAFDELQGPLPTIEFSFLGRSRTEPPLKRIGAPPSWRENASPYRILAPQIAAAAELALEDALTAGEEE